MTTLPLNEVKTRFSALADEVAATHERITVTRNGRPHVVILAVDDFEALEMTLELSSIPDALDEARSADSQIDRGEYLTADDVHELIARRRAAEQETEGE